MVIPESMRRLLLEVQSKGDVSGRLLEVAANGDRSGRLLKVEAKGDRSGRFTWGIEG